MPYYAIICKDRADALQTRMDTRQAHLDYVAETGNVLFGGPMLHDGQMRGSLLVIEAPDLASAKAWSAGDPYLAAGLFDSVDITEWKRVVG